MCACVSWLRIIEICSSLCDRTTALISRWDEYSILLLLLLLLLVPSVWSHHMVCVCVCVCVCACVFVCVCSFIHWHSMEWTIWICQSSAHFQVHSVHTHTHTHAHMHSHTIWGLWTVDIAHSSATAYTYIIGQQLGPSHCALPRLLQWHHHVGAGVGRKEAEAHRVWQLLDVLGQVKDIGGGQAVRLLRVERVKGFLHLLQASASIGTNSGIQKWVWQSGAISIMWLK